MSKKRLLLYIIISAVFAAGLVYKVEVIKKKSAEEKTTVSSIWAKDGRPVYTTLIKNEAMPLYTKITVEITGKKTLIGHLPANLGSFVKVNQVNDLEIEGKSFTVIARKIGDANYSGFIPVKARSVQELPWEKGTLVVARTPYNGRKKGLVVPLDSIYYDGKDENIYLVVDNKVQIKKVKVITKNHKYATVAGQFKAGDKIITSDQRDLVQDELVRSVSK